MSVRALTGFEWTCSNPVSCVHAGHSETGLRGPRGWFQVSVCDESDAEASDWVCSRECAASFAQSATLNGEEKLIPVDHVEVSFVETHRRAATEFP